MRSQKSNAIRVQLAAALQLSLPTLRVAGSEAEGCSDAGDGEGPDPAGLSLPPCSALPLPPILHLVQDPAAWLRARLPAKQVMEDAGLEVQVRGRGEDPLSS